MAKSQSPKSPIVAKLIADAQSMATKKLAQVQPIQDQDSDMANPTLPEHNEIEHICVGCLLKDIREYLFERKELLEATIEILDRRDVDVQSHNAHLERLDCMLGDIEQFLDENHDNEGEMMDLDIEQLVSDHLNDTNLWIKVFDLACKLKNAKDPVRFPLFTLEQLNKARANLNTLSAEEKRNKCTNWLTVDAVILHAFLQIISEKEQAKNGEQKPTIN